MVVGSYDSELKCVRCKYNCTCHDWMIKQWEKVKSEGRIKIKKSHELTSQCGEDTPKAEKQESGSWVASVL